MTGIDTEATYVHLLAEFNDRRVDTCQLSIEDRKEQGLSLEVSISDAGTELNAGMPKAFPDICVQPDIIQEFRPIGAEAIKLWLVFTGKGNPAGCIPYHVPAIQMFYRLH